MSIAGVSAASAAAYVQQPQTISKPGTQTEAAATSPATQQAATQQAGAQQPGQVHHHHHHHGGGEAATPSADITQSGTDAAATSLINTLA